MPPNPAPGLRLLTSPRNPVLRLARALETKKVRRERRLVVVEGEDLVEAALDRGIRPQALLVDEERAGDLAALLDRTADVAERYAVPRSLMEGASTLAAAPRVIAILPQPKRLGFADVPFPPRVAVWLAGVADPGNVGTLVRSAAALGADWLATGPGSADPYHPRAVRASMGATFQVPLLEGVRGEDLATRTGFTVIAAAPRGGTAPWETDLTGPCVLALGAERGGLEPALEAIGEALPVVRVTIPQSPGTESLNVSAAGAVLLAEALRQRTVADGSV